MTRIGIAGDWHGDAMSAIPMLKKLNQEDIQDIYHLGDFGLYDDRDGIKYLRAVTRQLKLYGQRIWVTPGNHENYEMMSHIPVGPDGFQHLNDHIAIIPRGKRWDIEGTSFVSLGGAASVNFTSLKEGKSWWTEEAITTEDVIRTGEGGYADVMLTHEAPLGIKVIEDLKDSTKDEFTPIELAYSHHSQRLLTYALETVRPKMLFHGHFHIGYHEEALFIDEDGQGFSTSVYGMNMNRHSRNIGILETPGLSFKWIN